MKTVHNPLLKENSHHSQGYFPANYYMMVVKGLEQILPTHWHEEWEFFFVVSGRAVFLLNDERIPLETGEMVFVPASQVHAAFAVDKEPCSYNALVFHSSLLAAPEFDIVFQRYITPLLEGQVELPKKLSAQVPWQAEIIDNVYKAYGYLQGQPTAYELKIKASIFAAFAEIYAHSSASGQRAGASDQLNYRAERIREIYGYIHENCQGNLTVQKLSKVVNMSPGYLCRFFKEMTGQTLTEYINHYRVSQAALMIGSTNKKLLEIALDVGFNNVSYFITQFKRYMEVTPSEFKKVQAMYYENRADQCVAK